MNRVEQLGSTPTCICINIFCKNLFKSNLPFKRSAESCDGLSFYESGCELLFDIAKEGLSHTLQFHVMTN